MVDAYLDAMRSYAVFQGRTSHAAYWRAHRVFGPLQFAAFVWLGLPFADGDRSIWPPLLFMLIVLPHALPWTALTVRRLHDMDLSGWWALFGIGAFIPVVPLGLIILLLRCARGGQRGPNRFGPDPLGREPMPSPEPSRTPETAAPTPAPAPVDLVGELERLAQLRVDGTLSESEFEVMKAHALARSDA